MTLVDRAVERITLEGHDGRSGAKLERVVLDDGTRLVVKTADPRTDLTLAMTGGVERERVLFESGAFERLRPPIAHPILEVWSEGDATVTVMRDIGDAIPGWTRTVTTAECELLAQALGVLHAAFLDDVPDAACPMETRLALLSPESSLTMPNPNDGLSVAIRTGWTHFADLVPADVYDAVRVIHHDPQRLATALARTGPLTLTHGDLWLVNMAIEADCVTLLDWTIATAAPPALDLEMFLTGSAAHMQPTREEFIELFRKYSPSINDDAVALALVAGLVEMGWNKALDACEHDDPAMRERERIDLEWWVTRVRAALAAGLV